jgi:hypothetical protein
LWAFFCGKTLNAKDIHKEMFPAYGGKCLSRKAVHNWVDKSPQGRSKVAGAARPGRPVEAATVQRVEELIRTDRRIAIDSVAMLVEDMSLVIHGTVLHEHTALIEPRPFRRFRNLRGPVAHSNVL